MGRVRTLTIGTRGSKLALWQAQWVKDQLESRHGDLSVKLMIIKTKGDKILDVPLAKVGGKGLFVKEIEDAMLKKDIDLAVHSMKDMPADLPQGLCIAAVPERESPFDVLIARHGKKLADLPQGAKLGTSSLRRGAQILHARPDIEIVSLRGNVDTRLKKLETENLDAIILAAAGVKRMNHADYITEYLDENIMLPAVGQGALCLEAREHDPDILPLVTALNHTDTYTVVMGERAFLNRLEGGCQVPMAALGKIESGCFHITGLVASLDGKSIIKDEMTGDPAESEHIGTALADNLLKKGADRILDELKALDTHETN